MRLLDERLHELMEFETRGSRALTLYLNTDPARESGRNLDAEVHALLRPIRMRLEADAVATAALENALTQAMAELQRLDPQPRAAAVFVCPSRALSTALPLPERVEEMALFDDYLFLRPLVGQRDRHRRVIVALIDARSARFLRAFMGEIEELGWQRDDVPRATGQGGTSHRARPSSRGPAIQSGYGDRNIERHNEWHALRHLEHVLESFEAGHLPEASDRILIGGSEASARGFMALLPPAVRARSHLMPGVPIDAKPQEVLEAVERAEATLEREADEQLVHALLEADSSRAVFGPAAVAQAAAEAQILTLVYDRAAYIAGAWCPLCRWMQEGTATPCPRCGTMMRATDDLADRIADAVIHLGGGVEEISGEAATRLKDGRGVAALLRYAPKPTPAG